ncbi:hypothetical protein MYX84_06820 [Acidobacteria bacterium AH-259-O06]|nr:hypothetical protein [Acidobacteria bacterium AH-259-O06]
MGTDLSSANSRFEIIGVVGHVVSYGVEAGSREELYFYMPQGSRSYFAILVKTESNPEHMVAP